MWDFAFSGSLPKGISSLRTGAESRQEPCVPQVGDRFFCIWVSSCCSPWRLESKMDENRAACVLRPCHGSLVSNGVAMSTVLPQQPLIDVGSHVYAQVLIARYFLLIPSSKPGRCLAHIEWLGWVSVWVSEALILGPSSASLPGILAQNWRHTSTEDGRSSFNGRHADVTSGGVAVGILLAGDTQPMHWRERKTSLDPRLAYSMENRMRVAFNFLEWVYQVNSSTAPPRTWTGVQPTTLMAWPGNRPSWSLR